MGRFSPLIRELVGLDPEVAQECLWFDLGDLPEHATDRAEQALLLTVPPYPRCALVGHDADRHRFLLFLQHQPGQQGPDVNLAWGYVLQAQGYRRLDPMAYVCVDGELRVVPAEPGAPLPARETSTVTLAIVGHFLSHVHAIGYRGAPKANSLVNRQRKAKGKPPLIYDWHTVTIEPPQAKAEPLGGTHASPRQHERRGHYRQCASGKRVFVRACVVGDGSRGAVFKDYRVPQGDPA